MKWNEKRKREEKEKYNKGIQKNNIIKELRKMKRSVHHFWLIDKGPWEIKIISGCDTLTVFIIYS